MLKRAALFLSILALAVSVTAQTPAGKVPATTSTAAASQAQVGAVPSKETVDSFMKHMFGWDKNITYDVVEIKPSRSAGVSQVYVVLKSSQGQQSGIFYVMPDGKFAILGGDLMPFGADPFAPARQEIAARASGPTKGPANAAVTVVEFSDLECPACKAAQPNVDRLMADEPDVKFIFQNYPLENLHPWALLAAKYADCVSRQNNDAFWTFVRSVYRDQDAITALLPTNATNVEEAMKQATPAITKKLQDLVAATPANSSKVAMCTNDPATAERIRNSVALGTDLDVTGTPTLYVNGRRLPSLGGMPYETLKAIVDAAKSGN